MIYEEAYDYLFKIVIVGDSGVGKSNLLLRYTANEFIADSKSTIGVEFATKSLKIDNCLIKAQIWDTSGQERYKAITSAFYRGAVGALLVYDVSRKVSFDHINQWFNELREHTEEHIPLVLIGNKLDLADTDRQVNTEAAKEYAAEKNMLFFETSAYDATNVKYAFETMFDHVYHELGKNKLLQRNDETISVAGTRKPLTLTPPSAYGRKDYNREEKLEKEQNSSRCC